MKSPFHSLPRMAWHGMARKEEVRNEEGMNNKERKGMSYLMRKALMCHSGQIMAHAGPMNLGKER